MKQILIESCQECPYKRISGICNKPFCEKIPFMPWLKEYASKGIHPDCPLPDKEETE